MTYISVDVDVDISEFNEDEIADYLRDNGYTVTDTSDTRTENQLIAAMYELYRDKKPIDAELRELFYTTIGRIA